MLVNVFSVSLFLSLFVAVQCSPCTDYKMLGNSTKRLLSNVVASSTDHSELLCDAVDGWYRLETGQVASACVQQYGCGTAAPIWLNDRIPAVHTQEMKTFCVDHGGATQKNKCCTFTRQMPVMNCGKFLVIRLSSSLSCPSAICLDPSDHAPAISLKGPYLDGEDFSFHCEFNNDQGNPQKPANVTWLFDGVPVKSELPRNPVKVASLGSAQWVGRLGSSLSCKVNINNIEYESTAYWGGIKIEATPDGIREGEETTLTIQSTLPITCESGVSEENCHLDLALVVDGEQSYSGIFGVGECNATLHRLDWNTNTLMVETNMTIVSSIDPVVKPNSTRTLSVEAVKGQNVPDLWKKLHGNTTIMQTDVEHTNCFLFGQNHIRGIDSQLFSLSLIGDFLMFDGDSAGKTFKIQTRHMMVGDSLPSTCAVAVKYSGHVIIVDMCHAHDDDNTETLVVQGGDLNSGMYTSHCGMDDLELSTDTDIRVEIKVQKHNLDVNVHFPPSINPNQEGGFCVNSKPIRQGDLFQETTSSRSTSTNKPKFCDCVSDTSTCKTSVSRHVTAPIVDPIENMMYFCKNIKILTNVKLNDKIREFTPPVYEWSTFGGDQVAANKTCVQALKSRVPPYCDQSAAGVVPGFSSFQEACIEDIKNSGSEEYVRSSMQAFLWECQINLLKNPDNYMHYHDQYLPPAEVTSDMCPDFCNMHGECKQGSCQCDKGFMGEDCGVTEGAVPTIVDILGGYSCKTRHKDCSSPVLFIKDALRNLTAKLQPIEIKGGMAKKTSYEIVMNISLPSRHGYRMNISTMVSNFTDSTAYGVNITLSNDGVKFGNNFQYYVYDEVCHKCLMEENQWMCFERDTGCRIGGKCYEEGFVKQQDEICRPECHLMEWSKNGTVC